MTQSFSKNFRKRRHNFKMANFPVDDIPVKIDSLKFRCQVLKTTVRGGKNNSCDTE